VEADLFGTGWRTIFAVNLPIGVVAFVVAARFLPRIAPAAGPPGSTARASASPGPAP
jgi:predicted MFS family arabinose efflux permease